MSFLLGDSKLRGEQLVPFSPELCPLFTKLAQVSDHARSTEAMIQRLVHFADLFEDVWKTFTDGVQKTICADSSVPSLVPDVLKQLPEQLEEGTVPGRSKTPDVWTYRLV